MFEHGHNPLPADSTAWAYAHYDKVKPWEGLAMWTNRPTKPPGAAIAMAAFGLAMALTMANARMARTADGQRGESAAEAPAAGLGRAEFDRFRSVLNLKNQPWTKIPWKYSITEARRLAAASNKPIFMVVNTGNALGLT
jgi:hypothetical protein